MNYTFEILGVSPILYFFNHQQDVQTHERHNGAEYLGVYRCSLDHFIQSVEMVSPQRGWDVDKVVDTVVGYWLNNADLIAHWHRRLMDAGRESLLVARVGNLRALQTEFEFLIRDRE